MQELRIVNLSSLEHCIPAYLLAAWTICGWKVCVLCTLHTSSQAVPVVLRTIADGAEPGSKLRWFFGPTAIATSSSVTVDKNQL